MDFPVTAEFVGSANAGQLHDEAKGDSPEWPASFVVLDDGSMVYRVDDSDEYVEDDADGNPVERTRPRDDVTIDADAVRSALAGHVPAAPTAEPDDALRTAIEAATDLVSLKAALLGSTTGLTARVAGRAT